MGKEYEAQILNVDATKLKKQLKALGGKQVHKNIRLVRAAFERCDSKVPGFARVRYDGKDTTMTVKIYNNPKFPDETEVVIQENFEDGKNFLLALGLKQMAYQETYREKWSLPIKGVHEIAFDTWPGLPMWMEIDCTSEKVLNDVVKKLAISQDKIDHAASAGKYEMYYGISTKVLNENTPSLTFKNIRKEIKPKKNKDLFDKIVKAQQKKYAKN